MRLCLSWHDTSSAVLNKEAVLRALDFVSSFAIPTHLYSKRTIKLSESTHTVQKNVKINPIIRSKSRLK